ncbi:MULTISPECIES: hypothetical protein [unclassified Streptomyces]|uniref:hypothetical protein n=1 Tax=unclassified Streptomyces TaxID=2593676 RepID=UPI002E77C6B2|nr:MULTISPECIES: hypothetical protein [unclassified Streptomyces]MEE1758796.1 hypothetical protein [Streptomyces sp. SP18BB07]MEE1831552.1 hypothetical protein [Streptomyces sp. SP17KL33]
MEQDEDAGGVVGVGVLGGGVAELAAAEAVFCTGDLGLGSNVEAPVYVAAFQPDEGESALENAASHAVSISQPDAIVQAAKAAR